MALRRLDDFPMHRFTELPVRDTDSTPTVRDLPTEGVVDVYKTPSDGSGTVQIGYTALTWCNIDGLSHAEICANYLTALSSLFRSLCYVGSTVMNFVGYKTTNRTGFSEMVSTGNPVMPWIENHRFLALIAQAILILFEDISDRVSYEDSMRDRAIGLKAAVGYVGNLGPTDDFCVEFNAAFMIRRMLGSSVSLRASVTMELIRNRKAPGPVGAVCSYVCEILNWVEMDD